MAWRGAALQLGSSVIWQQAAPAHDPALGSSIVRSDKFFNSTIINALRWVIRGSSLLPSDRTAAL
jgi:hypothetical protein